MSDKNFSFNRKFINGCCTGLLSAYIFNPIDKALYFMVKDQVSVFDRKIWKNPYKGVTHALYSRIIGYGVYFTFYDTYKYYFKLNNLTASAMTGMTVALFNNPVNVIKMYNWNTYNSRGLVYLGKDMYNKYGFKIFCYGLNYTMLRDVLFSSIFYTLSEKYNTDKSIYRDIVFASSATILTSPINYFRNRIYFDFNNPVTINQIFCELKNELITTKQNKVVYLLHNKFNVGLGTLRVGIGMAVSKKIYEHAEKL